VSRITQIEESRRRFLVKALNIGAISSSFSLLNACSQSPSSLELSGSIFKLGGQVHINGQLATLESRIIPGDSIITGEKSYIIFVVSGESFILLSKSTMKLGGSRTPSPSIASINLLSGKMRSVFAPRKPMLITTPQDIVGIRGTGAYVEVEESLSYVCTCYGEKQISARKQPSLKESIKPTHHDQPKYIRQEGQQSFIEPAPFINHDDEELLLIETLVGRKTPYLVPAGVTRSRKTYY
jgi:hypothetical protein